MKEKKPGSAQRGDRYLPIGDYAYLSDCHSSALISRSGSIDWCCMPRIDSRSCFGRLLDPVRGGYCRISPTGGSEVSRNYVEDTLVLETTFRSRTGKVRLIDFFPMKKDGRHNPYQQILRTIEGLEGKMDLVVDISPRFDYGAVKPWIRKRGDFVHTVVGGSDGLLISGDLPLEMKERHDLVCRLTVKAGHRQHLSILYVRPEDLDDGFYDVPEIEELDRRLDETIAWWNRWISQGAFEGAYAEELKQSALVLKGLTNAPTGAIAAAATTSLPEAPGGPRNWDYRFTWVRDSVFALRSLWKLGFVREADRFRKFIERSAAGSADEIQIVFGVGGERRLQELELSSLAGYCGSRPVRIGNAAAGQRQLDVYGELLDLAWRWHTLGRSPDDDYWEFLTGLVDAAARIWRRPDRGIWEMRGRPRHFVHSKVMCWSALNNGLRLAKENGRKVPHGKWETTCHDIRKAVETRGYDRGRGCFLQAFGRPEPDAALLLLPMAGFVAYDDERMVRTTDVVMDKLMDGGLVRRYGAVRDGLPGTEGVFLACSFWLVECLARQGRLDQAREVFRTAMATGNDLGLFSEEFAPSTGRMLGNFPQGLSHLSLISAADAIRKMEQP